MPWDWDPLKQKVIRASMVLFDLCFLAVLSAGMVCVDMGRERLYQKMGKGSEQTQATLFLVELLLDSGAVVSVFAWLVTEIQEIFA